MIGQIPVELALSIAPDGSLRAIEMNNPHMVRVVVARDENIVELLSDCISTDRSTSTTRQQLAMGFPCVDRMLSETWELWIEGAPTVASVDLRAVA